MSSESIVFNLIQGIEFDDNRLYDLLNMLAGDVYRIDNELHPPGDRSFGVTGQLDITESISGFSATIFPRTVRFTWMPVSGLTSYQLRYNIGLNNFWTGANVLISTTTTVADIDPTSIPLLEGVYTFLIKAIDSVGNESVIATPVIVTISEILAPIITATVIDNFVLLTWTPPISQFAISHYVLKKNGNLLGFMNGTFEAIFETASGTYIYSVATVDICGNIGAERSIAAEVNQPPDFELRDSQFSSFSGTKVNCVIEDSSLLACVKTGESWENHFINNSWNNIQEQISAGFPLYIEPSNTSGSYEEVFDFGIILTNNIVTVRFNSFSVDDTVTVVTKIAVSDDNITYSAFTSTSSLFAASLRYAKVKLEFTGTDTTSLILISNLNILLQVKQEMDSGLVSAVSTDTNGTEVFFNKDFKDVNSITLTPLSTTLKTAIYNFVDIPNPVSFFVYLFNSSGSRVSGDVSWKVRGVV